MTTKQFHRSLRPALFASILVACRVDEQAAEDITTGSVAEQERCEAAQAELTRTCLAPLDADVNEDAERPTIIDIDEVAEPLDGGYFLPKLDPGQATDLIGFVLEENDLCRASCLIPCDLTVHSLCVATSTTAEGSRPSCLFCGEATREGCQGLINACE